MKLDRLMTVSQFVDYIYSEHEFKKQDIKRAKMLGFDLIVNYMQFLQQPLKKEMFVNECKKLPDHPYFDYESDYYNEKLKAWQESEKKVIFEDWKGNNNQYQYNEFILTFENMGISIMYEYSNGLGGGEYLKTLSDLAEETKGQLKLKNVEI